MATTTTQVSVFTAGAAVATVTWNDGNAIEAVRRGAMRGAIEGANIVRNHLIFLIQKTAKTGRVYKTKGVTHVASAPGEAPASDKGDLVRLISIQVDEAKLQARVVSGAAHSVMLEFGTPKIAPRPHLRRSIDETRVEVEAAIAKSIRNEMGG